MLGKRLLQSLPKISTLTITQNPQIKQLKTAHARSIDRKKNYATRAPLCPRSYIRLQYTDRMRGSMASLIWMTRREHGLRTIFWTYEWCVMAHARKTILKGNRVSCRFNAIQPLQIHCPGAKIINVFQACLGAQLTTCAQK